MNDTDPSVFKSLSSKMLGSQVSIPKCNKSEILQFLSCSKNYRLQLEMVYAFNPGPHEAEAGRSKLEVSHNYILDPPSLSKQSKLQISEHSGFADQGYSTNSNFINCIKAYFCKYQSSIFLQGKEKKKKKTLPTQKAREDNSPLYFSNCGNDEANPDF